MCITKEEAQEAEELKQRKEKKREKKIIMNEYNSYIICEGILLLTQGNSSRQ